MPHELDNSCGILHYSLLNAYFFMLLYKLTIIAEPFSSIQRSCCLMTTINVCVLEKNNRELILKYALQEKTFWIELFTNDEEMMSPEKSENVHTWTEAVQLLKSYKWHTYETVYVDTKFSDHVTQARPHRPKSINAQVRILEIYSQFLEGEEISIKTACNIYNVGTEQIKRDIKKIREFLEYTGKRIDYIQNTNTYRLITTDSEAESSLKSQIIMLLQFIYASRALNKQQISDVTNYLLQSLSTEEQKKMRKFFNTFHVHYKPVQTNDVLDNILTIYEAINQKKLLSFIYEKDGEFKLREVIPFSLFYHNSLFYLLATKSDGEFNKPISWRFDRISELTMTNTTFTHSLSYIEIGNMVNNAVNMFMGEPQVVRLRMNAGTLDYCKREFPNILRITKPINGSVEVEIQVNGDNGVILWILQQGENVEVLSPQNLREKVKKRIEKMYRIYH